MFPLALVMAAHAYVPGTVDTPYAQQGVDPNRAGMAFSGEEQVDLFSGQVTLSYNDHCVEGAYGLDMCITRTYSSKVVDESLSPINDDGWAGIGWLVNPGGRMMFDSALASSLGGTYYVWVQLPARGMERAVYLDATSDLYRSYTDSNAFPDMDSTSESFITASGVILYSANSGSDYYALTNGVQYHFDISGGTHADGYYYGDEIESASGETITITYDSTCASHATGSGAIDSMSDSYGRSISFGVDANCHIDSASYTDTHGTSRSIDYVVDASDDLTDVDLATGEGLTYTYSGPNGELTDIDLPTGGSVSYNYDAIEFLWDYDSYSTSETTYWTYVITDRDFTDGTSTWTWEYDYDDYSSSSASASDTTRYTAVHLPDGSYMEHEFWAACYIVYSSTSTGYCPSSLVGLPVSTRTYESSSSSTPTHSTYTSWVSSAGDINGVELNGSLSDPFASYGPSYMPRPYFETQAYDAEADSSTYDHLVIHGDSEYAELDEYGNSLGVSTAAYSTYYSGVITAEIQEFDYAWNSYPTMEGWNLVSVPESVEIGTGSYSSGSGFSISLTSSLVETTFDTSTGTVGWPTDIYKYTYPSDNASDDEYQAYTYTKSGSNMQVEVDFGGERTQRATYEYGQLAEMEWYDSDTASWVSVATQTVSSYTGQITASNDGDGNSTSVTYDALGRPTTITPVEDDPINITYDLTGSPPTVTVAHGATSTEHEYDGLGRHISSSTTQGSAGNVVTIEQELDGYGNVAVQYLPHHGSTTGYVTHTMDSASRTTESVRTGSGGSTYTTSWSYSRHQVTETDDNLIDTTRYLDGFRNVDGTDAPAGIDVDSLLFGVGASTGLGDSGNVQYIAMSDTGGGSLDQYRWTDDSGDVWLTYDLQNGGYTTVTKNSAGDVECVEDATGDTTVTEYDFQGRAEAVYHDTSCTPSTTAVYQGYFDGDLPASLPTPISSWTADNSTGRKSGAEDMAGGEVYAYDSQGRMEAQARWWEFAGLAYDPFVRTVYQYDAEGNTEQIRIDWGRGNNVTLWRTFAEGGVIEQIAAKTRITPFGGGAPTVNIQSVLDDANYHANGMVDSLEFGNGVSLTGTLDEFGLPDEWYTTGATTEMDLNYDFDGVHNITAITDAGGTDNYEYDDVNRLTRVLYGDTSDDIEFTYDDYGNMTDRSGTEATRLGIDFSGRTYTYNQDTTGDLTYDSRGAMTGTLLSTVTTNEAGQVESVNDGSDTRTYYRDSNDRVVGWEDTTDGFVYLTYDKDGRLLAQFSQRGGTAPILDFMLVYNGEMPIAAVVQVLSTLEVIWLHQDIHNTTRVVTDSSGVALVVGEVTPFGTLRGFSTAVGAVPLNRVMNVVQWAGHGKADRYGGINMGSRFMAPGAPGMLSADRAYTGDIANPQSLNRWTYAYNNPMAYTDPTGDIPFLVAAAIVWGAIEVSMSVADGVAFASTVHSYSNGQASGGDVLLQGGLLVAGVVGPGAGYGLAAKGIKGARAARMAARTKKAEGVSDFLRGGKALGSGSWSSAKLALPKRKHHQWHHLVEQTRGAEKFGSEAIHNTNNLIELHETTHRAISGFYSSKKAWTGGGRVRDKISKMGFDEQYQFGLWVVWKKGGSTAMSASQRKMAREFTPQAAKICGGPCF